MTPSEIAERAKALLDDPILSAAFEKIRKAQVDVFLDTTAKPERIEEARSMVKAIAALEAQLRRGVDDVKFPKRRGRPPKDAAT